MNPERRRMSGMIGREFTNPTLRIDPRWYQIAMLSGLLLYGQLVLGFGHSWWRIAAVLAAALLTQAACGRLWKLPAFDPLSALISGIGLCTLMRTDHLVVAVIAGSIAIASKFTLRWDGRHLWNPTNFVLALGLATGWLWISPGQYGHFAFAAFLIVGMGVLVVTQASRGDVSFAFIGAWAALLFARSLWLGEPLEIPIHRLQSGMLLQFTFNMISDPRTTPRSRAGRIGFGVLVALGAYYVQFVLFRTNGPVWSLAVMTLLVPLINRLSPGPRHEWRPRSSSPEPSPKGTRDETPAFDPTLAPGRAVAHGRA
jgi:hypothetical protein